MAITKSVEKKAAPGRGTEGGSSDPVESLALEYLAVQIHRALVRLGEPARISEIVREIGDESITAGLARHIMDSHPRRFVSIDRRWDIAARYLDKQAPLSKTLQEIVTMYGAPIGLDEVAGELSIIYGRPREVFDETAPRMLGDQRYFTLEKGGPWGLRSWLLDTEGGSDDNVLFYNYLTRESVAAFAGAAKFDWVSDPVQAAREFLVMADGVPVDNRVFQWYAWKALGDDFDAEELYGQLFAESLEFIPLPDHRWVLADSVDSAREFWTSLAERVADFVEEAAPIEPVAEVPAKPLEVTANDLSQLRSFIRDREDFVSVGEFLSNVLEVAPGSRTYDADTVTLAEFLKQHSDDFVWVGSDRFRAPDTLPPYLGQLPESLTFPVLPRFETADGEILDQLLADEAFDDALISEMMDSHAQDVNDQDDQSSTRWPEGVSAESKTIRLVLKSHHKEIGTFPIAQIPHGFLPPSPSIVEITIVDTSGNTYPVYVDYNVQLIYGLFDLYADIVAESGAVIILEKTEHPAVFKFFNTNETDSGVFVSQHRFEELSEYRTEVEAGPVSTYDIIRRILDHYRKGCSFLTLLTEVNLVRRTPRRLIASILSGYTAFHERANRWTFDPKKEPEGFDRRKTEFIISK